MEVGKTCGKSEVSGTPKHLYGQNNISIHVRFNILLRHLLDALRAMRPMFPSAVPENCVR